MTLSYVQREGRIRPSRGTRSLTGGVAEPPACSTVPGPMVADGSGRRPYRTLLLFPPRPYG